MLAADVQDAVFLVMYVMNIYGFSEKINLKYKYNKLNNLVPGHFE